MLRNKKILLGICGSIAAYKSAFLTRLLVKAGAEVKVVLTPSATTFVAPLTFSTLSKNPALTEFVNAEGSTWNNHVDLSLWADCYLIAPGSANTIAKMANGICDNLLMATYLSAKCPVWVAPAMDLDMWKHPATQKNIETLQSYGNTIVPVGDGELASGLEGEGRMAEPEEILSQLEAFFGEENANNKGDLSGKKILITAGPTYEPIDPVRFIGNRSSGKMGVAIAEEAASRGAEVTLILGPAVVHASHPQVNEVPVKTAAEMYEACVSRFDACDIAILSAAVADYTPENPADQKIKKQNGELTLNLIKTQDILKSLGEHKKQQILVGFALETNNEMENAALKLEAKNADMIVLNSLRDKGAAFGQDTNKVTILGKNNNIRKFELKSKQQVAKDILNEISSLINA